MRWPQRGPHYFDAAGAGAILSGAAGALFSAELTAAAEPLGAPEWTGAAALFAASGAPFFVQTMRPKREALWKLPWPRIGDQATPPLFFIA